MKSFVILTWLSAFVLEGPSAGGCLPKSVVGLSNYPPLARAAVVAGEVDIKVSCENRHVSTLVLRGHPLLATASKDNIREWKFEKTKGSKTTVIKYVFVLQGTGADFRRRGLCTKCLTRFV